MHATLPRNICVALHCIAWFKMQRRRCKEVGIAKVFKGNLNWGNDLWKQEIFLVWWWQSFFADWLCGSRSRPNHKSAVDSRLEPAEKILIVKKTLGGKLFFFLSLQIIMSSDFLLSSHWLWTATGLSAIYSESLDKYVSPLNPSLNKSKSKK